MEQRIPLVQVKSGAYVQVPPLVVLSPAIKQRHENAPPTKYPLHHPSKIVARMPPVRVLLLRACDGFHLPPFLCRISEGGSVMPGGPAVSRRAGDSERDLYSQKSAAQDSPAFPLAKAVSLTSESSLSKSESKGMKSSDLHSGAEG